MKFSSQFQINYNSIKTHIRTWAQVVVQMEASLASSVKEYNYRPTQNDHARTLSHGNRLYKDHSYARKLW